jgi:hypothetical protein
MGRWQPAPALSSERSFPAGAPKPAHIVILEEEIAFALEPVDGRPIGGADLARCASRNDVNEKSSDARY